MDPLPFASSVESKQVLVAQLSAKRGCGTLKYQPRERFCEETMNASTTGNNFLPLICSTRHHAEFSIHAFSNRPPFHLLLHLGWAEVIEQHGGDRGCLINNFLD
jgi:hypothetical protein